MAPSSFPATTELFGWEAIGSMLKSEQLSSMRFAICFSTNRALAGSVWQAA